MSGNFELFFLAELQKKSSLSIGLMKDGRMNGGA
jgi:hypothetical protein